MNAEKLHALQVWFRIVMGVALFILMAYMVIGRGYDIESMVWFIGKYRNNRPSCRVICETTYRKYSNRNLS